VAAAGNTLKLVSRHHCKVGLRELFSIFCLVGWRFVFLTNAGSVGRVANGIHSGFRVVLLGLTAGAPCTLALNYLILQTLYHKVEICQEVSGQKSVSKMLLTH
jgi:hypothetical protein